MPENKVDQISFAYSEMRPRWELINGLLGGTEQIRKEPELFILQHQKEKQADYIRRVNNTTLLPVFEETVDTMTARVFRKPISFQEGFNEALTQWNDDIDRCGSPIQIFAQKVFKEALSKGFAFVMVDYPRMEGPATIQDEIEKDIRPYFVHIKPEQVIAAHNNKQGELAHIRIKAMKTVLDGFSEKVVDTITVLEKRQDGVYYDLWVLDPQIKEYELQDSHKISLDFIPIVTFYTAKNDDYACKPPLLELAYKNIEHLNSASDQSNILTTSRFPMISVSGINQEQYKKLEIGPNRFLASSDPQSRFEFIETTGAAIEAGRQHNLDLKEEMARMGSELLVAKQGVKTATQSLIDTSEATSELKAMAIIFADTLTLAYTYMGAWLSPEQETNGKVILDTEFTVASNSDVDIKALLDARANGDISRMAFLTALKRRDVLHQDYDAEEDMELIREETIGTIETAQVQIESEQQEEAQEPEQ